MVLYQFGALFYAVCIFVVYLATQEGIQTCRNLPGTSRGFTFILGQPLLLQQCLILSRGLSIQAIHLQLCQHITIYTGSIFQQKSASNSTRKILPIFTMGALYLRVFKPLKKKTNLWIYKKVELVYANDIHIWKEHKKMNKLVVI